MPLSSSQIQTRETGSVCTPGAKHAKHDTIGWADCEINNRKTKCRMSEMNWQSWWWLYVDLIMVLLLNKRTVKGTWTRINALKKTTFLSSTRTWLLQTALSLMHAKQKLMWIAYWATAVPFFEKHIGHAFNLSSEARHWLSSWSRRAEFRETWRWVAGNWLGHTKELPNYNGEVNNTEYYF